MFSLLPIPSSPPPSLLTLPPELRLQIFALALSPYPKTLVTFHLDPYQREDYVEATQPALTRVSRQLRAEALPLFYQQNSFVLHSEGKKGDERERWFRGMGIWVEELRTLEMWVRFWKRGGDGRGGGIVGVGLKWEGGRWRVGEVWRWVCNVRKPAGLERDGEWILKEMVRLIGEASQLCGRGGEIGVEGHGDVVRRLREGYVEWKNGRDGG
ncbi:hypothetical protein B0A48_08436 [Cryoendolithus antarcticus]|uniref:2EXR domain-containing protein n=1 Tax=Cryoendolithus antarcticus TaxID=1507870 RepID=A0A1V8T5Q3_9PEZI|nr:hypothetical protein B0A48_08436 [Cryoendolithus antarcticus]